MFSMKMCPHYKKPNIGLLILRIGVGLVFILAGVGKLVSLPMTTFMFGQMGLESYWVYIVAVLEVLGGLALLVGFYTWVSTIVLSVIMVVASVITLRLGGGFMGALSPLTLLLVNVALFFTGPGKFSLDSRCGCGDCKPGMCDVKPGGNGVCVCSAAAGMDTCGCDANCPDCSCAK